MLALVLWGCFGLGKAVEEREAEKHYNRGTELLGQGSLEGAEAEYGDAIRLRPDFAEAYAQRALAHALLGKDAAAQRDFERAVELGYDGDRLRKEFDELRRRR